MIEVLTMQGYGSYIWSAYGLSFVLLSLLLGKSIKQLNRTKSDLIEKLNQHVP